MNYHSRLRKAFEGALRLPLNTSSKYVLFSDCHRGTGSSNDNFLKNQTLYTAALQYYLKKDFTYLELGDGDELWENRDFKTIIDAHSSVFSLLARFYEQGRLHMLYGNHDIEKATNKGVIGSCHAWPCCCHDPRLENRQLFPELKCHEGILLEMTGSHTACSCQTIRTLFLVHGHQTDTLNSALWPLARFLVRYVWKPLERFGVSDPTSAARNYRRKRKTENRLHTFATARNLILIAGHTHRPLLSETDLSYCNCGSCVHPYSITCLEIAQMQITLVKWQLTAGTDMQLRVMREVISGPLDLH